MTRWKSRPFWTSVSIGLAVFLIICGLWRLGFFQSSELWVYDRFISWRADPRATDPRIVLVAIKETDIQKYDWPLRDSVLANLLQTIEQDRPRVIGVDLYRNLPEPRDGSQLGQLNQVLVRDSNIVCIFLFGTETDPFKIGPPPGLANSENQIAFNGFPFDYQTVRRGFLSQPNSGTYQSLAWLLACWYLYPMGISPENVPPKNASDGISVKLGKTTFTRFRSQDGGYVAALDGGYQILMDYKGPRNFTTYTVDNVLSPHQPGIFHDKIVIIGSIADSLTDFLITPVTTPQPRKTVDAPPASLQPGLVVHAHLVNQFLRAALDGDQPTTFWSIPEETLWIFGWCMASAALGFFCRSSLVYGSALIGMLAVEFFLAWFAFQHGLWLLSVVPAAAIVAAANVKVYMAQMEAMQRTMLMRIFSQHVSSDVAQSMWERREEFMNGNRPRAQKLVATVVFTDLKDYSGLTEKLEPDVLMAWIDEYLGALGGHVARNGGMINKFIGDAIMAIFGAPFPRTTDAAIKQDAVNAVQCALDMKKEIQRLNAKWEADGLPLASMRIGIYTGAVMGGLVGHADRLEYTTIGDAVNTAARLESVSKEIAAEADGHCRILVGEQTFILVNDKFATEHVGDIKLKGQSKTTAVYRILGRIEPAVASSKT